MYWVRLGVPAGQHEPVAAEPRRVGRVVRHDVLVEQVRQRGQATSRCRGGRCRPSARRRRRARAPCRPRARRGRSSRPSSPPAAADPGRAVPAGPSSSPSAWCWIGWASSPSVAVLSQQGHGTGLLQQGLSIVPRRRRRSPRAVADDTSPGGRQPAPVPHRPRRRSRLATQCSRTRPVGRRTSGEDLVTTVDPRADLSALHRSGRHGAEVPRRTVRRADQAADHRAAAHHDGPGDVPRRAGRALAVAGPRDARRRHAVGRRGQHPQLLPRPRHRRDHAPHQQPAARHRHGAARGRARLRRRAHRRRRRCGSGCSSTG